MNANPPTGLTGGRYTLPAELGGGEVDVLATQTCGRDRIWVDCILSTGRKLPVPFSWLTPVKPPLPPEPPDGSVVRAGEFIAERDDKMGGVVPSPIGTWFTTDDYDSVTWATLVERALPGVPVLLVPDPFAEPVQLPWKVGPVSVAFDPHGLGGVGDGPRKVVVAVRDETAHILPSVASRFARAVWAAANLAQEVDHG